MKKAKQIIFTLLLIVSSFSHSKGQTSTVPGTSVFTPYIKETKFFKRAELRKIRKEYRQGRSDSKLISFIRSFTTGTFAPQVSVDLLDGKGIHRFTISHSDLLPAMNVGARFHAGIIITL